MLKSIYAIKFIISDHKRLKLHICPWSDFIAPESEFIANFITANYIILKTMCHKNIKFSRDINRKTAFYINLVSATSSQVQSFFF